MSLPESPKALPQNEGDKGIEMEKGRRGGGGTDYALPFVTLGGTVDLKLRESWVVANVILSCQLS